MAGSEVKSIMSAFSKSDVGSTMRDFKEPRLKKPGLHQLCSPADMLKFKDAFESSYTKKLTPLEFRLTIKRIVNIDYDDEEFKLLFMKINTTRNGEICWDELVSHLLLGYFENDPDNQRETLTLPIMGLPRVIKSEHRHSISRICFSPDVAKDRTFEYNQGAYVTVSRDGTLNWWSLDMTYLRTAVSTCPHLKVQTTWVTDMVCLPDVNIVVTSSTERDLRFYDCTAKTFTLKLVITSWEYMICTMHYHFHKDISENSILICGDSKGNVRILLFSPILRGPFQNKPDRALITLRHVDMQKGRLPEIKLVEFKNIHTDWVRQVSYYSSLHCFVSCSTSPNSLLMCDISASKTYNMFKLSKGIQCFAFDEDTHVLVTGGPDCTVRVWNAFVPAKPILVFQGHHAGIISIVLQNNATKIFSVARDRAIKVWDVHSQSCIQTYIDIPSSIGERTPISVVYNPATREIIMASLQIATIVLDEVLNPDHTDGFTHSKAISKVLYNPLFKVVITCGHDSIFINWDPVTGKRNVMVREAHTRLLHGELVPVEITAACFDPGNQLLCTGARDGSVKLWNFNTGICLRIMAIEHMCEVTAVFWVEGRILAVGWNRHVTEWEDGGMAVQGKVWETRHSDDVLAAAARPPLSVVTSSYSGELVMWKLETGQPYRRFSCKDPTLRIKLGYSKKDLMLSKGLIPPSSPSSVEERKKSGFQKFTMIGVKREGIMSGEEAMAKARTRHATGGYTPQPDHNMRALSVHAVIFLETREQLASEGSCMVAVENGNIQCWSDHSVGGYKGSFYAVHFSNDYVTCFDTDADNEFLFTGTTLGYVKIWHMFNYMTQNQVHVNMPRLRLMFPFLWRDRLEGRAKRVVRDQPLPLLLSSYRAHLRSVTTIAYLSHLKFVVTGSSDYSARMWRLSGEYLQTLGSFVPWTIDVTRHPPDVKKVASFTTLKVWNGGECSRFTPGQKVVDKLRDITEDELSRTYGEQLQEPLLGSYFKLPKRPDIQDKIVLDDSLPIIPIYKHLRMASTQPICRPPTPDLVKQTRVRRLSKRRELHWHSSEI